MFAAGGLNGPPCGTPMNVDIPIGQLQFHSIHEPGCLDSQNLGVQLSVLHRGSFSHAGPPASCRNSPVLRLVPSTEPNPSYQSFRLRRKLIWTSLAHVRPLLKFQKSDADWHRHFNRFPRGSELACSLVDTEKHDVIRVLIGDEEPRDWRINPDIARGAAFRIDQRTGQL